MDCVFLIRLDNNSVRAFPVGIIENWSIDPQNKRKVVVETRTGGMYHYDWCLLITYVHPHGEVILYQA